MGEAKKSNLEFQAAQASYESAERQVRAAQSGYFPQVYGSMSGLNDSGSPTSSTSYGASLNASQNLFAGFADQAKVKQAEANLDLTRINLDSIRAKVSADLKIAFSGLAYAQNYLILAQDILKRREGNLRLVELRFESGRENRGSVLLSKAYLEQSKYEFLQAQNAIQTAQAQLAKVLGRESVEGIAVVGSATRAMPPSSALSAEDFRSLSLKVIDYRQAMAQDLLAEANLSSAKSGFFPSLNLTGSVGTVGPDWYPQNNRWSVGASLNWPLWSGGKEIANFQASKSSLLAAKLNLGSSLESVLVKLKQTLASFEESIQKETVDEAFVAAAVLREKIAKEKYNNGLTTFEDWDLIENDLISRQKSQLLSLKDRTSAEANWEQLIGKGALL